jgi:hypothetical protein
MYRAKDLYDEWPDRRNIIHTGYCLLKKHVVRPDSPVCCEYVKVS